MFYCFQGASVLQLLPNLLEWNDAGRRSDGHCKNLPQQSRTADGSHRQHVAAMSRAKDDSGENGAKFTNS